jgi:hypothetical protein
MREYVLTALVAVVVAVVAAGSVASVMQAALSHALVALH